QMVKSYERIGNLSSELAKIFQKDMDTTEQLRFWFEARFNIDIREVARWSRQLATAAEHTETLLKSEIVHRCRARHDETPETWLFLALHDLYAKLNGREPGIAGPLHRFIKASVNVVDNQVAVPEPVAFRARLSAAL